MASSRPPRERRREAGFVLYGTSEILQRVQGGMHSAALTLSIGAWNGTPPV